MRMNINSSSSSAFVHNWNKQRSLKKKEKSPPKSSGEQSEALSQMASKFIVGIKLNNLWRLKKYNLNDNYLQWMERFLDRLCISYINFGN